MRRGSRRPIGRGAERPGAAPHSARPSRPPAGNPPQREVPKSVRRCRQPPAPSVLFPQVAICAEASLPREVVVRQGTSSKRGCSRCPGSNRAAWGSLGVAPCLLFLLPARGCLRSQASAGRRSRRTAGEGASGERVGPGLAAGVHQSVPRASRACRAENVELGRRALQASLNIRRGVLGLGLCSATPAGQRRAGPQQDATECWSVLGTPALPLDPTA